jgi:hypothetical protein
VRGFEFEGNPWQRYERLIEVAEKTILWLGIIGLSWARDHQDGNAIISDWRGSLTTGGVSLGTWFQVALAAEAAMANAPNEIEGYANALRSRKRNEGPRGALEQLIAERNRRSHGGGPRTEVEARARTAELEPRLLEAIEGLAFLGQLQWILPSRIRYDHITGEFQIAGFSIVGEHPVFEPVELISPDPLSEDEIYLESASGQKVILTPFCVVRDCEVCLKREIFFPSRLEEKGLRLVSFDQGHELVDVRLGERIEQRAPRLVEPTGDNAEKRPHSRHWSWDDYAHFSDHDPEKLAIVQRIALLLEHETDWDQSRTKNQIVFRKGGEPLLHLQFWAQMPRIYVNRLRAKPTHDPLPTLKGRAITDGWVWDIPAADAVPENLEDLVALAEGTEPASDGEAHGSSSEESFEDGMLRAFDVLKEFDYQANRFLMMVRERGGVRTAKDLIQRQEHYSQGFLKLVEIGKLEWSVEAYMLRPEFRHLFDPHELDEARRRLKAAEFDVDRWEAGPWT